MQLAVGLLGPPERHRGVAVTLKGFEVGPSAVPLLVADLGVQPGGAAANAQRALVQSGLEPVRTLDREVYPARSEWSYDYLVGVTPVAGSFALSVTSTIVLAGPLEVSEDWADLERDLGFAVVAMGPFNFADFETSDPQIVALQIKRIRDTLAGGYAVGATLSRKPVELQRLLELRRSA